MKNTGLRIGHVLNDCQNTAKCEQKPRCFAKFMPKNCQINAKLFQTFHNVLGNIYQFDIFMFNSETGKSYVYFDQN